MERFMIHDDNSSRRAAGRIYDILDPFYCIIFVRTVIYTPGTHKGERHVPKLGKLALVLVVFRYLPASYHSTCHDKMPVMPERETRCIISRSDFAAFHSALRNLLLRLRPAFAYRWNANWKNIRRKQPSLVFKKYFGFEYHSNSVKLSDVMELK